MKKYLNHIGAGVEPTGRFLHDIRRVTTRADFFRVCTEHLDHDHAMPLEPFPPPPPVVDELRCSNGNRSTLELAHVKRET
jgi:hypothetical protein